MNTYHSWHFYKRLSEIIGNLPQSHITDFKIEGGVEAMTVLTIKQHLTDEEDNLIINKERNGIESKATRFMVITEDEYNSLTEKQ